MEKLKLGMLPFKDTGEMYLRLDDYLDYSLLPPLPTTFGQSRCAKIANLGMMGNDKVGDCTVAALVHAFMIWIANAQGVDTSDLFTTEITLKVYSDITGYNPNIPQSDKGAQMQDIVNYFINTGITDVNGKVHKIMGKVKIDTSNWQEVLYATYLFEISYLGIRVPDTAQNQFAAGEPWTYEPGSAFEGGHAIPGIAKESVYYDVVTWGAIQKATVDFMQACMVEGWVLITPDMFNKLGCTPEGFNSTQLQADLLALSGVNPIPAPNGKIVDAQVVKVTVGAYNLIADGVEVPLDQPAFVTPDTNRLVMPVHAVANQFSRSVAWNEVTRTATFTKVAPAAQEGDLI
jgi:hypothetical protein